MNAKYLEILDGKATPRDLGVVDECPVCKSKDLKDESSFFVVGVSCNNCGWYDVDGGIL